MKKAWVASLVASSLFFGAVSVVGAEEVVPKEKPGHVLKDEKQALNVLAEQRKAISEETKQLRTQIRELIKQTPKKERKQLVQSWLEWKKSNLPSKEQREQRKAVKQAKRDDIKAAIQQKDFAAAEKGLQELLALKQSNTEAAAHILAELQQLLNEMK
ncbi:MAG: hypothetical protein ACM32O_18720 [Clostridia bacterium]